MTECVISLSNKVYHVRSGTRTVAGFLKGEINSQMKRKKTYKTLQRN